MAGTDLFTMPEAAELLRKSTNTMRYLRQQGIGPKSFKMGRRVYYRREDLEKYIADAYAEAA